MVNTRSSGPPHARLIRVSRRYVESSRTWWQGSLPGSAVRRVRELDLDTHALALCAQQVLCTAPLVVAMSAVLRREEGDGVGPVSAKFFGLKHEAAQSVSQLLDRSSDSSVSNGALIFSLITAVVFSTSVASVQQRAFELIWSQSRLSGVRSYLRQLVWAVVLGGFCLAMLYASKLGHYVNHHVVYGGFVSTLLMQAVLTFAFYLWSQHWLMHGRVPRIALVPGALAVAVGTAAMFRISKLIVPRSIVWQTHAYGLIGVAFVLSAWLMALCMVIFGGVLFGGLFYERRSDKRTLSTLEPMVAVDGGGHVLAEIDQGSLLAPRDGRDELIDDEPDATVAPVR